MLKPRTRLSNWTFLIDGNLFEYRSICFFFFYLSILFLWIAIYVVITTNLKKKMGLFVFLNFLFNSIILDNEEKECLIPLVALQWEFIIYYFIIMSCSNYGFYYFFFFYYSLCRVVVGVAISNIG